MPSAGSSELPGPCAHMSRVCRQFLPPLPGRLHTACKDYPDTMSPERHGGRGGETLWDLPRSGLDTTKVVVLGQAIDSGRPAGEAPPGTRRVAGRSRPWGFTRDSASRVAGVDARADAATAIRSPPVRAGPTRRAPAKAAARQPSSVPE
jgi:hypothetical protein